MVPPQGELLNPQGRAEAKAPQTFLPMKYQTPHTFRAANATQKIFRTASRLVPTEPNDPQLIRRLTASHPTRRVRAETPESDASPLAAKPRTHTYRLAVNYERFSMMGTAC